MAGSVVTPLVVADAHGGVSPNDGVLLGLEIQQQHCCAIVCLQAHDPEVAEYVFVERKVVAPILRWQLHRAHLLLVVEVVQVRGE